VLVAAVHGAPGGLCGYAVIAPQPGLHDEDLATLPTWGSSVVTMCYFG
jgi:hypothetical protein